MTKYTSNAWFSLTPDQRKKVKAYAQELLGQRAQGKPMHMNLRLKPPQMLTKQGKGMRLPLTQRQLAMIQRKKREGKGMQLKLSPTQMKKGGFLSSLIGPAFKEGVKGTHQVAGDWESLLGLSQLDGKGFNGGASKGLFSLFSTPKLIKRFANAVKILKGKGIAEVDIVRDLEGAGMRLHGTGNKQTKKKKKSNMLEDDPWDENLAF